MRVFHNPRDPARCEDRPATVGSLKDMLLGQPSMAVSLPLIHEVVVYYKHVGGDHPLTTIVCDTREEAAEALAVVKHMITEAAE